MGKPVFASTAAVLSVAVLSGAIALGVVAAAEAMPQPEPSAVAIPIKVEQVTAAAHLTWRDAEHNTVVESNLVTVGEVPVFADGGCRMRDSAQDAAPPPRGPTTAPHAPPSRDDQALAHPKGRWIACS